MLHAFCHNRVTGEEEVTIFAEKNRHVNKHANNNTSLFDDDDYTHFWLFSPYPYTKTNSLHKNNRRWLQEHENLYSER